jgi:hypothetical protein
VFTSLCRSQNGSRSYWGLLYHISSLEGRTITCQNRHSWCADLPTVLNPEHKWEAKIYQGFADGFREGNRPLMVKPARLPDLTLSLASPHHTPALFNPGLRSEEPAWLLLHEIAHMRAFGLENRRVRPVVRWFLAIIAAYCACALAAFRAPSPRVGRESPVPNGGTFRTLRGGVALILASGAALMAAADAADDLRRAPSSPVPQAFPGPKPSTCASVREPGGYRTVRR